MPEPVIGGIMGLIILSVILSPFLTKKREGKDFINLSGDEQDKDRIFSQLVDLEYDYNMGKLSKRDFVQSKNELTVKAAHFFQTAEDEESYIQLKVDKEIEQHMRKNGLEQRKISYEG